MNMNFGMYQPFGCGDRYGYNSGNAGLGGFFRGQCFLDRTFNSADGMHNVVTERTHAFRDTGMDFINNHLYAGNFWGNGNGMLYGMEYNNPWNGNFGGNSFNNYPAAGGAWASLGIG